MVYGCTCTVCKGRARWNLRDCGASSPWPRSGPPLLRLHFPSLLITSSAYEAASIDPALSRLEEHGFEQTAPSSGSSRCVEDPAIAEDGPLGSRVRARQHSKIL